MRDVLLFGCHIVLAILLISSRTHVTTGQGYNLLVGGGSLVENCDPGDGPWSDEVYGWFVDRARAAGPNEGNGRVLVLDYEPFPGCHDLNPTALCSYFECLGAAQVDHVCVTKRGGGGCLAADAPSTYSLILQYDGLWFRGGDQSRYVSFWTNTATEDAIHDVWEQGGVLGGTSAGAMIQSEIVSIGDAPSWEATGDPYKSTIQLAKDFLSGLNTVLPDTLVDSHFTVRARMGRLAVFLGRLLKDDGRMILGIGIDSETGLAVDPYGVGQVLGEGSVWFLHPAADSQTVLQAQKPAFVSNLKTDILTAGFKYDLTARAAVEVPPSALPAIEGSRDFSPATIQGSRDSDVQKAEWYVDGLTVENAVFHGNLTLQSGSGELDNGLVSTNLEDASGLRENRAGGPLWGLAQNPSRGIVVYTDGFNGQDCSVVRVNADETLSALPAGCPLEQSVIVVDCCDLEWVDQSTADSDGNGKARQSVALTPCLTTLFGSSVGPATYDASCGGSGCIPSEDPEITCSDVADNDCDGDVDCQDADCGGDPACPDCLGEAEPCSTGLECCSGECKRGKCTAACSPSTEVCTDGVDNDCDGSVDCADSDCGGDPICSSCQPQGSNCSQPEDCCSGNCNRGKCKPEPSPRASG